MPLVLITRRSLVRIQPPLPRNPKGVTVYAVIPFYFLALFFPTPSFDGKKSIPLTAINRLSGGLASFVVREAAAKGYRLSPIPNFHDEKHDIMERLFPGAGIHENIYCSSKTGMDKVIQTESNEKTGNRHWTMP